LKLNCDVLLSTSAFTFNLRRYLLGLACAGVQTLLSGRGLHSSTFRLNSSAFCGIGVQLGIV